MVPVGQAGHHQGAGRTGDSLPPVAAAVESVAVTLYEVMAEPPLEAGAVKATVARVLPAVALTVVGRPGTVFGTTALEAVDAGPAPAPLLAVTVKV